MDWVAEAMDETMSDLSSKGIVYLFLERSTEDHRERDRQRGGMKAAVDIAFQQWYEQLYGACMKPALNTYEKRGVV